MPQQGKKIFFASDAHLGLPIKGQVVEREKRFVKWLDEIKDQAGCIFLLGDIFDYWYEYKKVVPRGFTRLLGKISEITDRGIPVHFFTGNHDIWVFDYLPQETGIILHKEAYITELLGKKFFLAHGDGLGPGDKNYKLLKKIFTSRMLQWLFSRLHPNFSIWFAHKWSRNSRKVQGTPDPYLGDDKEWLVLFAKEMLKKEHFDYFIFGHRHIPLHIPLNEKAEFMYLGDWISHFTYAVFDGEKLELKKYTK